MARSGDGQRGAGKWHKEGDWKRGRKERVMRSGGGEGSGEIERGRRGKKREGDRR